MTSRPRPCLHVPNSQRQVCKSYRWHIFPKKKRRIRISIVSPNVFVSARVTQPWTLWGDRRFNRVRKATTTVQISIYCHRIITVLYDSWKTVQTPIIHSKYHQTNLFHTFLLLSCSPHTTLTTLAPTHGPQTDDVVAWKAGISLVTILGQRFAKKLTIWLVKDGKFQSFPTRIRIAASWMHSHTPP